MSNKLFFNAVRDALKHFHDPIWLGQHSPLATPYFLGDFLLEQVGKQEKSATLRGQILSDLLLKAAQQLWQGDVLPRRNERRMLIDMVTAKRRVLGNKGEHYYFLVLELRYFRRYFSKFDYPFDVSGIREFLGVGNNPFFGQLRSAVRALIVELMKLVRPTFRLEQPRVQRSVFGRNTLTQTILKQLQDNQAVTLIGAGGMGKTTVGTIIYNQWKPKPTFWYTFRAPLNDQYDTLLFSLAHFLNQREPSMLWLQLMVDGGRLKNHNLLQGYLKHDLQSCPLLCFDEIDRLATTNEAWHNAEHHAILELLELLIELTPVMLIGQRSVVDTLHQHQLSQLSLSETVQLLAQTTPAIDEMTITRWHQISRGNPRLLLLFAMLHANGESIRAADVNLSGPFQRLWRRLSIEERALLASLAVFRSPAPADAWQDQQTLNALIERQLVMKDAHDGVEFIPLYRKYLYQYVMSRETREHHHEQAALVRARLGSYTACAFHYSKAGESSKALAVWYPHRKSEIARGFGASARAVFIDLSTKQLSASEKKRLQIVLNDLSDLTGDLDSILASAKPRIENTFEDAILDEQEGRAWHLKGQSDHALTSYNDALVRLAHLINQASATHFRRGRVFVESQQLPEARQEAKSIFHFYQRLQAIIARRSGDFSAAEKAFLAALDSAEHLSPIQVASMHQELMFLYGQKGHMERATAYAELAMEAFKAMGDHFQYWVVQTHLAAIYMQAQRYEESIKLSEPILQFFRQLNHTGVPVPELFNTLAEAYFELGDLDNALVYAQQVLHSEERQLFPYAGYTLARIHIQNQKHTFAHQVFEEALAVANQNEDMFICAYLLRERSKLHTLEDNPIKAQPDLEESSTLFRQMGLDDEIGK